MSEYGLKPSSAAARFVEMADVDGKGFSRKIGIDELKEAGLGLGNGGGWCRDTSKFGKTFNVRRYKEGGRIVAVQLHGFKQVPRGSAIPAAIAREVKKMRCPVLGSGKPECDHKDGWKVDPAVVSTPTVDDFQPLSKAANVAKREHCKRCWATRQRFRASTLGFPIDHILGNGEYVGSCVGCYWHDVRAFHENVVLVSTEGQEAYRRTMSTSVVPEAQGGLFDV